MLQTYRLQTHSVTCTFNTLMITKIWVQCWVHLFRLWMYNTSALT